MLFNKENNDFQVLEFKSNFRRNSIPALYLFRVTNSGDIHLRNFGIPGKLNFWKDVKEANAWAERMANAYVKVRPIKNSERLKVSSGNCIGEILKGQL